MNYKLITLVNGELHEVQNQVMEETPIITDGDMNPIVLGRDGKFYSAKIWRVLKDKGTILVNKKELFDGQKHEFAYRDIVLAQEDKYPIGPHSTINAQKAYQLSMRNHKVTIPMKVVKHIDDLIKQEATKGEFRLDYAFDHNIRYNDRIACAFHFRRQGFFVETICGEDVLVIRW